MFHDQPALGPAPMGAHATPSVRARRWARDGRRCSGGDAIRPEDLWLGAVFFFLVWASGSWAVLSQLLMDAWQTPHRVSCPDGTHGQEANRTSASSAQEKVPENTGPTARQQQWPSSSDDVDPLSPLRPRAPPGLPAVERRSRQGDVLWVGWGIGQPECTAHGATNWWAVDGHTTP